MNAPQQNQLSDSVKTLWDLMRGEQGVVAELVGLSESYVLRLQEIGIFVGAPITCVNQPPMSAPKVFQICDGVFSLDRDIASKIAIS